MSIVITEESHNRVAWQANRPVVSVLIGILAAGGCRSVQPQSSALASVGRDLGGRIGYRRGDCADDAHGR